MKIKKAPYTKGWYVVFKDEYAADQWAWLFRTILRRPTCCFSGYLNSYHIWGPE